MAKQIIDKKSSILKTLAKRLSGEKSELALVWANQVKSLGGSYNQVSLAELTDRCIEFIEAFVEVLQKSKFLKLRAFIDKISNIRSSQGFRISEVQRAYYSFHGIAKSLVGQLKTKEKITEKTRGEALDTINNILIDTLFELSEAYHRNLNEKMDNYIDTIEKMNLRLKETSIRDELTGCYNQRYFQDILNSELSRTERYKRPLAFIMFDLDHFKKFNDKYGHLFGDEVLKTIGEMLRKSVRGTDWVFRYGGEEFSVILPETKKEKAATIAERIRQKIFNTPIDIKSEKVTITISGGVSQFDPKLSDKNSLIANADEALYSAKKQGRNKVVVYQEPGHKSNRKKAQS